MTITEQVTGMDTLLPMEHDNDSLMSYIGQDHDDNVNDDDDFDDLSLYAYSISAASNLQGYDDDGKHYHGMYHRASSNNNWDSYQTSGTSTSSRSTRIPTSVVFQKPKHEEEQNRPLAAGENDDDEMLDISALEQEEKDEEVAAVAVDDMIRQQQEQQQQRQDEHLKSSYIMSTIRKQHRLHEYHGETEDETSADSGSEISNSSSSHVHDDHETKNASDTPATKTKNKKKRRFWKSIRKSWKSSSIHRRFSSSSKKQQQPTPSQILQLEKEVGLASAEESYRSERRASF